MYENAIADATQDKGCGEPSLRKPLLTRKRTLRNGTYIINKGENVMTELALENRIALLEGRQKDNQNIVKKLRRKLRKLKENNTTK